MGTTLLFLFETIGVFYSYTLPLIFLSLPIFLFGVYMVFYSGIVIINTILMLISVFLLSVAFYNLFRVHGMLHLFRTYLIGIIFLLFGHIGIFVSLYVFSLVFYSLFYLFLSKTLISFTNHVENIYFRISGYVSYSASILYLLFFMTNIIIGMVSGKSTLLYSSGGYLQYVSILLLYLLNIFNYLVLIAFVTGFYSLDKDKL